VHLIFDVKCANFNAPDSVNALYIFRVNFISLFLSASNYKGHCTLLRYNIHCYTVGLMQFAVLYGLHFTVNIK